MSAKIVVADDDESVRSILQYKLSSQGYELHCCTDGVEAREYLNNPDIEPDGIILDVMMPRLDGKQLLRTIRRGELAVPADIPIMMLTSRGQEADILDGFESGADEYIKKPFSPEEVSVRLKRLVGIK